MVLGKGFTFAKQKAIYPPRKYGVLFGAKTRTSLIANADSEAGLKMASESNHSVVGTKNNYLFSELQNRT